MKICLIGNDLRMMVRFRRETIDYFIKLGFDVHIICPRPIYPIEIDEKITIHTLDFTERKISIFELIQGAYSLRKILRFINPNLIISFSVKPIFISIISNIFLKIPLVSFLSGLGYVFTPNFKFRGLGFCLIKFIGHFSSEIVVLNQDDFSYVINRVSNCPINICPGEGINLNEFKKLDIYKKEIDFLYLGRLIDDKGFSIFLDAVTILSNKLPARFACAGSGPGLSKINMFLKSGQLSPKAFSYLGQVTDIKSLISKSRYLVLPSMREGISRAIMEAMSLEVVCIGTDVPGIRQLISHQETGFLIDEPNSDSLERSMFAAYFLKQEDYEGIALKAKNFVQNNYAQEYVDNFYGKLIERHLLDKK